MAPATAIQICQSMCDFDFVSNDVANSDCDARLPSDQMTAMEITAISIIVCAY